MIRHRAQGPVQDVDFRGGAAATAPPEAIDAIARARAVIIGPSNPIISIGPMLAVEPLRTALRERRCPAVAVSPLHRGEVLKGPTAEFMAWAGHALDSDGIVAAYAGLIDGLVADARTRDLPTLETDVLLADPESRRRVAAETLRFAVALV